MALYQPNTESMVPPQWGLAAPPNHAPMACALSMNDQLQDAVLIRLTPALVSALREAHAQGATSTLRLGSNPNDNCIRAGSTEFSFSSLPESACEVIRVQPSASAPGPARFVASASRKLLLSRSLHEERVRVREASERTERRVVGRKAVVLDPPAGSSGPAPRLRGPSPTPPRGGGLGRGRAASGGSGSVFLETGGVRSSATSSKRLVLGGKASAVGPPLGGHPNSSQATALPSIASSAAAAGRAGPSAPDPARLAPPTKLAAKVGAGPSKVGSQSAVSLDSPPALALARPAPLPAALSPQTSPPQPELVRRKPPCTPPNPSAPASAPPSPPPGAVEAARNGSLRSCLLALLAERPLALPGIRGALAQVASRCRREGGGGFALPADRAALERVVKSVALFQAPGRYVLRPEVRAEAERLARGEEGRGGGGGGARTEAGKARVEGGKARGKVIGAKPSRAPDISNAAPLARAAHPAPSSARARPAQLLAPTPSQPLALTPPQPPQPSQASSSCPSSESLESAPPLPARPGGHKRARASESSSEAGGAATSSATSVDEGVLSALLARGAGSSSPVRCREAFVRLEERFNVEYEVYFKLHQSLEAHRAEELAWESALGGEEGASAMAGGLQLEKKVRRTLRARAPRVRLWEEAFARLHAELGDMRRRLAAYVAQLDPALVVERDA